MRSILKVNNTVVVIRICTIVSLLKLVFGLALCSSNPSSTFQLPKIDILPVQLPEMFSKKTNHFDFRNWTVYFIGVIIVMSQLLPSYGWLSAHHILLPILIFGSLFCLRRELNIKIGHLVTFLIVLIMLSVHLLSALVWDGDITMPMKSIFLITVLFCFFIIFKGHNHKLETLSATLIASTIILLVANAQWFWEHRFALSRSYFDFSGYSSPNVSGMFLALVAVLAVWRCLFAQSTTQFFIFGVSSTILFASIAATNSRGALLSLILGVTILCCMKFGVRTFLWNVTKLSFLLALCFLVGIETTAFETTIHKNDFVSGRFDIWAIAISQIAEAPWTIILGKGAINYEFLVPHRLPIHSTHNSFLNVAYVYGLPSLLFLAVVFARIFNAMLLVKNNIYFSINLALFSFVAFQMMIDSHLFSPQFGWILTLPLMFTGQQNKLNKT